MKGAGDMNRRLLMRAICVVLAAALTSGCVYMNVQVPLDKDFNQTELGAKEGRASSPSLLWLVAWGDAGSKAAAKAGGIQAINHADTEFLLILGGLYTRTTTVAYGD